MSSIVLELQHDASEPTVRVPDLLRKALIAAKKLGVADFERWIRFELHGYEGEDDLPPYRRIHGELKAQNPVRGWIPLSGDLELVSKASAFNLFQSVAALEAMVEDKAGAASLTVHMRHVEAALESTLPIYLHFPRAVVRGVLDAVRTTVLEWALDLESRGILGEGLVFTPRERQSAGTASYSVYNYFGDGAVSQIQQGTERSVQRIGATGVQLSDLAHVLAAIRSDLHPVGEQTAVLAEKLEIVEKEIAAEAPRPPVIREALSTIKDIAVSASAAAGLIEKIAQVISALQ